VALGDLAIRTRPAGVLTDSEWAVLAAPAQEPLAASTGWPESQLNDSAFLTGHRLSARQLGDRLVRVMQLEMIRVDAELFIADMPNPTAFRNQTVVGQFP
jgi:hypothetical protein